jgi:predicted DsbA family dithiol-disulfide isomerase
MNTPLKIDIVSDVSCPWCIIGYQSLSKALSRLTPPIHVDLTWKPFELNPNMPPEGQSLVEHLHEKYGSTPADLAETTKMITDRGKALGFTFNFSEHGRIYNTFNAHRLLLWSRDLNKQTGLKLALFNLYFTQGGNPNNVDDLLGAVAKAGLPVADARTILDSERFKKEVREEEAKYLAMGVSSVPTFIINDKYKITGGQPVDTFVDTLKKIIKEETLSQVT